MTLTLGKRGPPLHGCNGADELCELIHLVGSTYRGRYVVGLVTDVESHVVLGFDECLDMRQRALDRYLNTKLRHSCLFLISNSATKMAEQKPILCNYISLVSISLCVVRDVTDFTSLMVPR